MPQVELSEGPHLSRVAFFLLLEFDEVLLGILGPLSQKLFFKRHPFVALLGRLPSLLLDQVVPLAVGLCWRDGDHQVKLVLLGLDHFLHSLAHLLDQVDVQLTVELVTTVFLKSLQGTSLFKMFSHNPDNGFLHLFLQNMVFAFRVYFI